MVDKVVWSDEYLLGVNEIDSQHKKLVEYANDLYDVASVGGQEYEKKMQSVLKNLTDYTLYHFGAEEEFMKKHDYLGIAAHKMAHDSFINEVKNQMKLLSADNAASGLKFYSFVANWVLTHIAKADKIWAKFVKENG